MCVSEVLCVCICEWLYIIYWAYDEMNPTLSASLLAAAENKSFH